MQKVGQIDLFINIRCVINQHKTFVKLPPPASKFYFISAVEVLSVFFGMFGVV